MFPGVCIAIPHRRDNGKQFSMRSSTLMEPRSLFYMTQAAHGQQLHGAPDALVRRVCTDSRQIQAADLFVALRGDRFDGHQFVAPAARMGITGAVVERQALPLEAACPLVVVDDTRAAFGRMAARYRQDFDIPIIAVAGSNGKTTTKELIASVLNQKFKTLSSRASFNNDVGVPTTLLEIGAEHRAAVLEFGTNHPGELAPLLRLAQPRYGVLTSIGREHLEFFGSLDGVIQEEGWLAELLPSNGKLFINGDTEGARAIAQRSSAAVVTVGLGTSNAWWARNLRMDEAGVSFDVQSPGAAFGEFRVPLLGRHQAINALLAIAVAAELGLQPEEIRGGLLACPAPKMRLQLRTGERCRILDDSYNANADSMRAALDTLRELPCRGRRIAVLGDMAELGAETAAAHAEIGHYAASAKVDHLITIGRMAEATAQAARDSRAASDGLWRSRRGGGGFGIDRRAGRYRFIEGLAGEWVGADQRAAPG